MKDDKKGSSIDVVFSLLMTKKGILLFRNRESAYWELPAGPPHDSEDTLVTAFRLSLEQTNIELESLRLLGTSNATFEGNLQVMNMGVVQGYVKEVECFEETAHFSDVTFYDKANPPTPLCSTCEWIISEYIVC